MAIGTVAGRTDGVVNSAHGSFVGDGAVTNIILGFVARHIVIINETDAIRFEKVGNMAAANCLQTLAVGTQSIVATSLITQVDGTLTIAAGIGVAAKTIRWVARA